MLNVPVTIDELFHTKKQFDMGFTSPKLENISGIFLPSRNITKSRIYDDFINKNQKYVLRDDEHVKITITGRLLTQKHKDVLESLITGVQGDYGEIELYRKEKVFKIIINPNQAKQAYSEYSGTQTNAAWFYEKLTEIGDCGVQLDFKDKNNQSMYLTFIDSVYKDDNKIIINFSIAYTVLIARTFMYDYRDYLKSILGFSNFCKKQTRSLKREIHTEPIRAIMRFMLMHKDRTTYNLETIFKELGFYGILSKRQIQEVISDLKDEKIREYLEEELGIFLSQDCKSVSIRSVANKKRKIRNPINNEDILPKKGKTSNQIAQQTLF